MDCRRPVCCIAALTACLWLPAIPAQANTRFGFGTIVAVDADGKQNPKRTPGFQVRFEFRNLAASALWYSEWYSFRERTRHGERVYFLDGKRSNHQEAVKAGRAVSMTDNDMVCFVSSLPGPQALNERGTAENGLYRIVLGGAFGAELAAKDHTGKYGEPRAVGGAVELLLDVRDGAVCAGAAVIPLLACSDFDLDCAGLKRNDAAIEGAVQLTALFPEGGQQKLKAGDKVACAYTLKASADDKGVVTGTFEGKCGEREVKGRISGERVARSALPPGPKVWLDFDTLPGVKSGYAVFSFENGKAKDGGYFLFKKGFRIGEVNSQDLALDAAKLAGRFKGRLTHGGKPAPVEATLETRVLANRFVFGAFKMTVEGGETIQARVRGGLCDAGGPQIEGCTAEQQKAVKEIQAALAKE